MTISVLEHRDALRLPPTKPYIDGEWRDSRDGSPWTHVNPATEEAITTIDLAGPGDVAAAVAAARGAFDEGPWPRTTPRDRKRVLQRMVDLLRADADRLNRLQTLDNAMPIWLSESYDCSAEIAADLFDHHAGWIDKINGETIPYLTGTPMQFMTLLEPVGVVAAIIPWNAPLLQFAQKVAPALAAGCTVVVKPSEYASLTPSAMTELLDQLDLPPGVINLVPGTGPAAGEALITNPQVDKISFTGSRAVGSHILRAAATDIKRTSLELGGKSAAIVFPDAVEHAATQVMRAISTGLSGQVCAAQTRALVHESAYDEFVRIAEQEAKTVVFGDPFDPATTSAPMINEQQLTRVLSFIEEGRESGATLVTGGSRAGDRLAAGHWVEPTLFADVDNRMSIAQQEIFGPVLSVIPFRDEAEAVAIANDTTYGLSAGIYTENGARAMRVGRALRTGTVGVNGYTFQPNAPFGGYKQSGLGREGGWSSIAAFLETKTMMIDLTGQES